MKTNDGGAVKVDEFIEQDPELKKAMEEVAATGDLVLDAPLNPDNESAAGGDVVPHEEETFTEPTKPDDGAAAEPTDPKPDEPVDWKVRAEKTEARIAELTKKLNDRDGAHGTELAQIRQQNILLQAELERARAQRGTEPDQAAAQEEEPDFAEAARARYAKLPKKFKDQFSSEQEVLERLEWDIAQEYAINGSLRDGKMVKPDDVQKMVLESINAMSWYGKVEAKAPGFLEANGDESSAPGDPGWVEHLKKPVFPGSKMTLGEVLSTASEDAVAEQFNLYKKDSAAEPAAEIDPSTGVKPISARRPTLAQLASSRAGASATTTTQPGKKTFTQAQVDELERKASVPGARPDDRRAFEEAMDAYLAGRVVG